MTIHEAEERTGLTRANIRYYEQEGLLYPRREPNGYRDYGEADVTALRRIQLLRRVGVSIEQLRALQSGELALDAVLAGAQAALERKQAENGEAQALCRAMRRDAVSYDTLDAEKYTACPEPPEGGLWEQVKTRDAAPPVTRIWRRYFARMLDYALYQTLWRLAAGVGLRLWLDSRSLAGTLGGTLVTLLLMAVLEPLWLHWWGTTPGKFLFGLHLEQADGRRPSYAQGFARSLRVIWYGLGAGIPVYSLIRLAKCAWRCSGGGELPWEEDAELYYSLRDEKWQRFAAAAGAGALLLALWAAAAVYPLTPPNRGDLTPEELVENYNYYAAKLEVNASALEYADGELRVRRIPGAEESSLEAVTVKTKQWTLTEENGVVTGVTVTFPEAGASRYEDGAAGEQILWALSLAGAQKSVGLFSRLRSDAAAYIAANAACDYVYPFRDYVLRNDVTYSGYEYVAPHVLVSEDDEYSFSQVFTVERR